jgi:hypothetical protein
VHLRVFSSEAAQVFVKPLREQRTIPEADHEMIFGELEEMLAHHTAFLARLKEVVRDFNPIIFGLFFIDEVLLSSSAFLLLLFLFVHVPAYPVLIPISIATCTAAVPAF